MSLIKIVMLCIGSAILYGILHDQVTARVCVEYFTIGHPPVFKTESSTLLALGWGTIATWWMGLILGLPLALIARLGRRPKLSAADFAGPIGRLLLVMAVVSVVAGLVGYGVGRSHFGVIEYFLPETLPWGKHAPFVADAFAHEAAYWAGGLGGLVIWIWAWRRRTDLARDSKDT